MLVLTDYGYIGSTNALLRQCYEFLCWAKFAIDNDKEEVLKALHDAFYDNSSEQRADVLKYYFRRTSYENGTNTIATEKIINEGKKIFSSYAHFTHASSLAQQCPVPTEYFYDSIKECVAEIAMWIFILYKLAMKYFIKSIDAREKVDEDIVLSLESINVYNNFNEKLIGKLNKLEEIYGTIYDDLLDEMFVKTKWIINL